MVMVVMEVRVGQMIGKLAVGERSRRKTCIHTCLIQGQRVKGCKHSNIRENRRIVFADRKSVV